MVFFICIIQVYQLDIDFFNKKDAINIRLIELIYFIFSDDTVI